MTAMDERYEALMAAAELAEMGMLPDDELVFYVGQALNLNAEDVQDDEKLAGLVARMLTAGDEPEVIVRRMLDYVYAAVG